MTAGRITRTRTEAAGQLAAAGYEAAEIGALLDEAQRFPGRYAYTADRGRCAVHDMPADHWHVEDCRESEAVITALATAGRHGWRLVPSGARAE